jgi:hypothetical protein
VLGVEELHERLELEFLGSAGIVEGLTEDLDDHDRSTAMANLATLVAERTTGEGVLIPSAAWRITARRLS